VRKVIVRRDRVVLESSSLFTGAVAQLRVRKWRNRPLQALARDTLRVNPMTS